jgi:hypothetical protein
MMTTTKTRCRTRNHRSRPPLRHQTPLPPAQQGGRRRMGARTRTRRPTRTRTSRSSGRAARRPKSDQPRRRAAKKQRNRARSSSTERRRLPTRTTRTMRTTTTRWITRSWVMTTQITSAGRWRSGKRAGSTPHGARRRTQTWPTTQRTATSRVGSVSAMPRTTRTPTPASRTFPMRSATRSCGSCAASLGTSGCWCVPARACLG